MLRAEDPSEFDDVVVVCRMKGHRFPDDNDRPGVEFKYVLVKGVAREAEVDEECERCHTVRRAVFDVLPGPRFIPKQQSRYTYPDDCAYILPKGAPRFTRADARGMWAARRSPGVRFPKAKNL